MRFTKLFICLQVVWLLTSCKSETERPDFSPIEDDRVKRILTEAMDEAGGWSSWKGIERISYTKKSILYHANGAVESEVNQEHRYLLKPTLKGSIKWRDDQGEHEIVYGPEGAGKYLNGIFTEGSEQTAYESFLSAVYVLFQPFKLLDPGTRLSYVGLDSLETGQRVEVIRASYAPDEHQNHSTADTWHYYFDQGSSRILANMVHHPPTYAYIENIEFTDDYPIRLHTYRESWRVDSLRNKEFLRGVFFYGGYQVDRLQSD